MWRFFYLLWETCADDCAGCLGLWDLPNSFRLRRTRGGLFGEYNSPCWCHGKQKGKIWNPLYFLLIGDQRACSRYVDNFHFSLHASWSIKFSSGFAISRNDKYVDWRYTKELSCVVFSPKKTKTTSLPSEIGYHWLATASYSIGR